MCKFSFGPMNWRYTGYTYFFLMVLLHSVPFTWEELVVGIYFAIS